MQVIYHNKDKRGGSRRTNPVDVIIYTRRISEYLKEKYVRRFKERVIGI